MAEVPAGVGTTMATCIDRRSNRECKAREERYPRSSYLLLDSRFRPDQQSGALGGGQDHLGTRSACSIQSDRRWRYRAGSPVGKPEQLNTATGLNPPLGMTETAYVADSPGLIVFSLELKDREKLEIRIARLAPSPGGHCPCRRQVARREPRLRRPSIRLSWDRGSAKARPPRRRTAR